MTSETVPDLAAGADAVRTYVSQVLVTKYDASREVADEIAQSWKFGNGHGFFDASSDDLKGIFGPEVGYLVYRSKRQDWKTKWRASTAGRINTGVCGIPSNSAILFWTDFRSNEFFV